MKKLLITIIATVVLAAISTSADAAKRKHVRIHKPSPLPACSTPGCDQWSRGNVPLVAIPPIAVAFDIARRTSCNPAVALTGGPGFEEKYGGTGNWLVPALYRSQCGGVHPKWYGW